MCIFWFIVGKGKGQKLNDYFEVSPVISCVTYFNSPSSFPVWTLCLCREILYLSFTELLFLLIWFPSPNCPSPSLLVAAALAPVLREASICCCAPLRSALCLILRWELASILSLLCSSSSLFSFVFLWFPFFYVQTVSLEVESTKVQGFFFFFS